MCTLYVHGSRRLARVSNLNVFRYACSTSSNCLLIRSRLCDGLAWLSNTVFITFAPHLNDENRSILNWQSSNPHNPRTNPFSKNIIFAFDSTFTLRNCAFLFKDATKASLFTEQLIRRLYACVCQWSKRVHEIVIKRVPIKKFAQKWPTPERRSAKKSGNHCVLLPCMGITVDDPPCFDDLHARRRVTPVTPVA